MILVCAADDYQIWKNLGKWAFLKIKILKKYIINKKNNIPSVWCFFSIRLDGVVLTLFQFDKTCTRIPYFLQKLNFAFMNQKT